MATYYALTTLNEQTNGWDIVALGADKAATLEAAYADIYRRNGSGPNRVHDIYTDTELKNLVVVSQTVARRRYGITDWSLDAYYGADDAD